MQQAKVRICLQIGICSLLVHVDPVVDYVVFKQVGKRLNQSEGKAENWYKLFAKEIHGLRVVVYMYMMTLQKDA